MTEKERTLFVRDFLQDGPTICFLMQALMDSRYPEGEEEELDTVQTDLRDKTTHLKFRAEVF
jgi:hypothetical protein